MIATETVEHDIRNKFGKPLLPRFTSNEASIAALRSTFPHPSSLQVLFGPVASRDEDGVEPERRQEIQNVEIRGVTDGAGGTAAADFATNLESVMQKVAILITSWVRNLRAGSEAD